MTTAQMLNKQEVIAYVGANANTFGLDPAAVLAVANQEGLNSQPGSSWKDPPGIAFGPPSWNSAGAGNAIVQSQGASASYWSWTPAGLNYWLQQVANSGAQGLTGISAINQIVTGFERPATVNIPGEIVNASRDYASFQAQIQTPLPGNIIVPTPDNPGGLQLPGVGNQFPTTTDPQQTTTTTPSTATGNKFSLHLLDTPWGPINFTLPWDLSGILLFLAALFAIIIGALLWDKSRNVIIKGGEVGAIAAA
jgi:hypothetical protein